MPRSAVKLPQPTSSLRLSWPWPLPALACWALAWAAWAGAAAAGAAPGAALLAGMVTGVLGALRCEGPWRRAIAALGFPLSAWAQGAAAAWPGWTWLLPLLPLLVAYPLRAWRDAPFFPTPADGLAGLDGLLPSRRRVLDAGCGLGHGLRACRRLWPTAELTGLEWSPLLAAVARLRCPWARVQRGDMWAASWSGHDLVYVFQRPESMPRIWAKACQDLPEGAWLVSLEFAVPGRVADASLQGPGRRSVWAYRIAGPTLRSIDGPGGR